MLKLVSVVMLLGSGCALDEAPETETSTASELLGLGAPAATIASITYGGTGCPNGSVAHSFDSARRSATLIFDRYVASTGVGVPITERRRDCQVNVDLTFRAGVSQVTATVDYRGFRQLASDHVGTGTSVAYDSGAVKSTVSWSETGPLVGDYVARHDVTLQSVLLAPTARPVNFKTTVEIDSTAGLSSQMTMDSIDIRLVDDLDLALP